MIVDDEVRILAAMRRSLRREGYEVLTIDEPAQALELLESRSVDLVISDQRMPGMRGVDFLKEVKRLCPNTPRMLITGWAEVVLRDDLDALGIDVLIPKPWDDAQLKEAIRKALASRA